MAYVATNWVEGVTTLGPTNMNHLEGGVATADANATSALTNAPSAAVVKSVITTAGDLIYGTGSAAVARLGIGASTQVLKGGASAPAWGSVALAEITGYPADATKFARGDGAWAAPSVATSEMAYVEFTTTKTATSSTEASAVTVVSAGAVSFDGATKVRIEFFAPQVNISDNSNGALLTLFDGTTATVIGQLYKFAGDSVAAQPRGAVYAVRELTPSNASHTYFVGILDAGAITATHAAVLAGAGGAGTLLPGFIRIAKAA
jgi:hypothetical protein